MFFQKKDPDTPKKSFNLRFMYAINMIAIVLFILGILYKLVERIFFN